MKKILPLILSLLVASSGALAQNVNIPDANFKAYLVGDATINTNSDSEIQVSEATAFTGSISIGSLGITDLTGIEAFVNITGLFADDNDLGSVDLSQNTQLTILTLASCNLSALDISQNTNLTLVFIENNNLNELDISSNTVLESLSCHTNSLTVLDFSNNPGLKYLSCGFNSLTELDFSQNPSMVQLLCADNSLTALNMKNLSTTTLTSFNATSNPNLTCIEVDDVAAAEAVWTNKDATASFSLDCPTLVTSIDVQGQGGATTITTDRGTLQMEATVLPADATDATYTWSVTNGTGEATIDANGLLSAVSNGTVTVTATANDGSGVSGDATITISNQVVLVNSISVQGESGATTITTNAGTLQMEATVLPADATDATYTWSVTNGTGEATIDDNGLLTAIADGIVTVTATANDGSGVSGDATITISNQIILGSYDQNISQEIEIYPNPVKSQIYIKTPANIQSVVIVDVSGKIIQIVRSYDHVVELSHLKAGIYILRLQTDSGTVSKKIFKE